MTKTDDIQTENGAIKARYFGEEGGDDRYAKVIVTEELLEDEELAVQVLDDLRDSIADEYYNR